MLLQQLVVGLKHRFPFTYGKFSEDENDKKVDTTDVVYFGVCIEALVGIQGRPGGFLK